MGASQLNGNPRELNGGGAWVLIRRIIMIADG